MDNILTVIEKTPCEVAMRISGQWKKELNVFIGRGSICEKNEITNISETSVGLMDIWANRVAAMC